MKKIKAFSFLLTKRRNERMKQKNISLNELEHNIIKR